MKFTPKPICLGIFCIMAFTPQIASAELGVTLYGRVVAGFDYVSGIENTTTGNSESLSRVATNQWGTSRFGLTGMQDLGGGLKVDFGLESGFNAGDGSTNGSALFNRKALVGLVNDRWGSVYIGKDLSITNDSWDIDPTGMQNIGSATLIKGRNWGGASNMVEYSTPTFGGFTLRGQVVHGQEENSEGIKLPQRAEGVSLVYENQGLKLRAIYSATHDPKNNNYSNVYQYSQQTIVGGSYQIGPAKLFAVYDYITAPQASAEAASKLNHAWAGVRYDLTPALTLIGAVYNVRADRIDGEATLLMAGAEYKLFSQTLLYASLGGVNNSNGGNFEAEIDAGRPGKNASQTAFYAGVAHTF